MMPKQYQQGWVEFYKLKFKVTPDVLIPRPETELLVDEVLKLNPKTVLDVGTGTGNIAIAVAKNIPDVRITAVDISPEALKIAQENAYFHQVNQKIEFIQSDLLEKVYNKHQVIVANLPYIPTQRIDYLDPSVKNYEPKIALDGGEDGFALYRRLFVQILQKNLFPKVMIAEIDYTHGVLAKATALKYFPKATVVVKTDLAHKQRILFIDFRKGIL